MKFDQARSKKNTPTSQPPLPPPIAPPIKILANRKKNKKKASNLASGKKAGNQNDSREPGKYSGDLEVANQERKAKKKMTKQVKEAAQNDTPELNDVLYDLTDIEVDAVIDVMYHGGTIEEWDRPARNFETLLAAEDEQPTVRSTQHNAGDKADKVAALNQHRVNSTGPVKGWKPAVDQENDYKMIKLASKNAIGRTATDVRKYKTNERFQRFIKNKVKVYDWNDPEAPSLLEAEWTYQNGDHLKEVTNTIIKDSKEEDEDQSVREDIISAVPFVAVNDLYVTPLFAGPEGWPGIVKALSDDKQTDQRDETRKKFCVFTGTHMSEFGMVHNANRQFSPHNQFTGYGDSAFDPGFFAQDVDEAKALAKGWNVEIDVVDIFHPRMGAPSASALRKEIAERIKLGYRCILPACYSSDVFMPPRMKDQETEQELKASQNIKMVIRGAPLKDFVEDFFEDVNDFKIPE